jgi:hypothetical protein
MKHAIKHIHFVGHHEAPTKADAAARESGT